MGFMFKDSNSFVWQLDFYGKFYVQNIFAWYDLYSKYLIENPFLSGKSA